MLNALNASVLEHPPHALASRPRAGFDARFWLVAFAIAATTFAAFSRVLSCAFISFDDGVYVTANPHVLGGLSAANVQWACTKTSVGFYLPATWLSLMLDASLFGPRAMGFHLTNLALHVANGFLLFRFLTRATGSMWRSAAVAALFSVHPLRVESVAWVTERKDVLSTFFALGSLLMYLSYTQSGGGWRLVISVLLFILSLLAKPMLVLLAPVLLALDYWPLGRVALLRPLDASDTTGDKGGAGVLAHQRLLPSGQTVGEYTHPTLNNCGTVGRAYGIARLLAEKIPFALAAIPIVAASATMQSAVIDVNGIPSVPAPARIANAVVCYMRYVASLGQIHDLALVYPFPTHILTWQVVGSIAFVLLISGYCAYQVRRRPWLLVGWTWYVILLTPTLQIVANGIPVKMADRFSYVPHVGLLIMLVWSAPDSIVRSPAARRATAAGILALVMMLSIRTWIQCGYWRDSVSLYLHTLQVTDNNWVIEECAGTCLGDSGDVDGAIAHLQRSIELEPGYAISHYYLGNQLVRRGRDREAIDQFQLAIQYKPEFSEAHTNLGERLAAHRQFAGAIAHYQTAIAIDPTNVAAYNDLGCALLVQGDMNGAARAFRRCLAINPSFAAARSNLGVILQSERK